MFGPTAYRNTSIFFASLALLMCGLQVLFTFIQDTSPYSFYFDVFGLFASFATSIALGTWAHTLAPLHTRLDNCVSLLFVHIGHLLLVGSSISLFFYTFQQNEKGLAGYFIMLLLGYVSLQVGFISIFGKCYTVIERINNLDDVVPRWTNRILILGTFVFVVLLFAFFATIAQLILLLLVRNNIYVEYFFFMLGQALVPFLVLVSAPWWTALVPLLSLIRNGTAAIIVPITKESSV